MRNYLAALRHWRFGLVWGGLTLSSIGDGLTRLALIWLTYHLRSAAADVGLLITFYSAPVILGGPLAGFLLDRFGARRMMMADNLIRGLTVGAVPFLYHLGLLQPWHLFGVAAVYGLFKMITLAGAPTLLPAILPAAHLNTANALEMVSFSLSSIIGPSLSGLLLNFVSGADVMLFDAVSYLLLAGCLALIGGAAEAGLGRALQAGQGPAAEPERAPQPGPAPGGGLVPALRFGLANPFLRNSTLMYMLLNVGHGVIDTLVPLLVLTVLHGDSLTLGLTGSATAVGDLLGSFLAGAFRWRIPYPRLIAWALMLGGLPMLLLAAGPRLTVMAAALGLSAMLDAPLTVWAQTVRMQLIPAEMRGSLFALLRTVMQAGPALGGLLGAQVVGLLAAPAVVGLAIVLISGPGVAALLAPNLLETRQALTGAPAA